MLALRRGIRVSAGGVILGLAWLAVNFGVPEAYLPLVRVLPEALALLILVLAWRYRRGRLALASLLLGLLNLLLRTPTDGLGLLLHDPAWTLLALLLIFNFAVFSLIPDRPLLHRATLIHGGLLLLEGVMANILLPGLGLRIVQEAPGFWALLHTIQAKALIIALALMVMLVAVLIRRGSFELGMLWVLGALCLETMVHAGGPAGSPYLLAAQLILLLSMVEDSYRLAFIDPLTGLEGRRALDERLRSLRGKYCLAMVDIDHFKIFNDRWGHESGDQALRMVARKLAGVGGGGRAYRYGGEEFTIVFENLDLTHAREHLETLREAIASSVFGIRGADRPKKAPPTRAAKNTPKVKISVSMGLACSDASRPTPKLVLKAADAALYRAKKAGRNRLSLRR